MIVREAAAAADLAEIVAYERLRFSGSHVGMKLYLGPRSGGEA
jgi:hypothetical protein